MRRVAIIGGGISGLSAAYTLEKERTQGSDVDYVLFESSGKLGGVLSTEHVDGCVIEAGPDSFITEKPWAAQLCRELGLGDQLIGSNDEKRKTYIVVNNRLIAMPDGLMFMVPTKILPTGLSPLFSLSTKMRMVKELFHPPRPVHEDETVAQMVERHFGREMVDRLADPLLSGVYGGDAAQLSVRAVLPRFVEMEEKHGSLSRAMLAARKKMLVSGNNKPAPPLFTSLRGGMQQLVNTIAGRLRPESLRAGARVDSVEPTNSGWRISANGQIEEFDAVIFATPARTAAALLQSANEKIATDLRATPYSSSVTVTIGYAASDLRDLAPGFGFLVPRTENRRMLACTFVHNKFPNRAPADKGLIRCFLGGASDEAVLGLSDDEILATVRRELNEIIKLDAEPLFTRVYRWRGAMAQYAPGHLDRVARIEEIVRNTPGLALAGNYFKGIGVPDCVRTGQEAAKDVLQRVKAPQRA
jgi:protoporphyrinogen/coproporphyrinogen III oxidase